MTFVPCVFFIPEISITNKLIHISINYFLKLYLSNIRLEVLNKFIEIILYF